MDDEGMTLQQYVVSMALMERARQLVEQARAEGFNLTIEQVSLHPLRMGNTDSKISLWPLLKRHTIDDTVNAEAGEECGS